MAITSHGTSTSAPADNGSQAGPTVAVAPVASMSAGDLVLITCAYKNTGVTMAMSETSGQTWTALAQCEASGITIRTFWAVYNGTWGSNPSVTITSGALAMTVVMHVFRPSSASKSWVVDVAQVELDFSAPSTPFTVTITGVTTVEASTVTYAVWATSDDNSWTSIAGSGWVVKGAAQYRNLTGQDSSCTFAHNIRTTQGSVANVSKNQVTVTGDAGTTSIVTFAEIDLTGTGSAATQPFGADGSGTETFSGSGSAALQPFGADGEGTTGAGGVSGTGSAALSSFASDASGAETFSGTGSAALASFAAAGSGTENFSASGSAALSPFDGTASGTVANPVSGSGSAALTPFAAASSGAETFSGSGTAATQPFGADGSGGTGAFFTGSGSGALASFGADSSGTETFTGSGSAAVASFGSTASGAETFNGSGSAAFASFACSGSGTLTVAHTGSGSAALASFSCAGIGTLPVANEYGAAFVGVSITDTADLVMTPTATATLEISPTGTITLTIEPHE